MNEFELYQTLCSAETIAAQYPAADIAMRRIAQAKEMISGKKYRLAVIGEFKRGKSSLVNALVGSRLLPTDILPTTAVTGRIIFGETKRIWVHYKDGSVKERTVEELEEYATKLDAAKEERAARIREIVIEYPSVFCRNGIEIIDTPGLNDNEQMSDVTLGVLGEVDSAIFTISAVMPLSMTETELLLSLLKQPGIRHITFVITFIDQAAKEREQQDRLIEYVRNRIQTELLSCAKQQFGEQPQLLKKAEDILARPAVFAVSSVLAMKGFEYDSPEILHQSRFPDFKQNLFELLVANQSADKYAAGFDCMREIYDGLDSWHGELMTQLEEEFRAKVGQRRLRGQYLAESRQWLQQKMQEMDVRLQQKGFLAGTGLCEDLLNQLQRSLTKPFIQRLSVLRVNNISDQMIRECLMQASAEGSEIMKKTGENFGKWIWAEMERIYNEFANWRVSCGLDGRSWMAERKRGMLFPSFQWKEDTLLRMNALTELDIMPSEISRIRVSLMQYAAGINSYIVSWRGILLRQNAEDFVTLKDIDKADNPDGVMMQKKLYQDRYRKNKEILKSLLERCVL